MNSTCQTTGLSGLPTDRMRAHVTLIPKEGKDPTNCSSYRPISLLNVDLKFFTKILAGRLAPWFLLIIHFDQVRLCTVMWGKRQTKKKVLSWTLDIFNGTRQGFPLSHLLLITTLEPFLHKIWKDLNITGLDISSLLPQKVSAYADDILLFISNPINTLTNLRGTQKIWGTL